MHSDLLCVRHLVHDHHYLHPQLLVTDRGFGEGTMGGIMSAIGAAWVFWGVAVPAISDRFGRKPTLIFFSLLAVCCPLF